MRRLAVPLLAVVLAASACAKKADGPVEVADAFADAYFRRADQEKAKEYTALGASTMLEDEIGRVSQLRKDGYGPAEAGGQVTLKRGEPVPRDQRVRVPYEVTVQVDSTQTIRDADVELTQIGGVWKVVRIGLRSREAPAAHEQ